MAFWVYFAASKEHGRCGDVTACTPSQMTITVSYVIWQSVENARRKNKTENMESRICVACHVLVMHSNNLVHPKDGRA